MKQTTEHAQLVACGRNVRDRLARAKRSLDDEIRTYPTPIPRCDAQFNYLYEQRGQITELLQRMDASLAAADPDAIAMALSAIVDRPIGLPDADWRETVVRIRAALAEKA